MCVVGWVRACCRACLGGLPNTRIFKGQVGSHGTSIPFNSFSPRLDVSCTMFAT